MPIVEHLQGFEGLPNPSVRNVTTRKWLTGPQESSGLFCNKLDTRSRQMGHLQVQRCQAGSNQQIQAINKNDYINNYNNMISSHTSPARIHKRHDMMSRETSERRMKTRMTSNDESFHHSWWAPVGMVLDLCPHCLGASTAETHMPGPNGQAKRPYVTANERTDKTNKAQLINPFYSLL